MGIYKNQKQKQKTDLPSMTTCIGERYGDQDGNSRRLVPACAAHTVLVPNALEQPSKSRRSASTKRGLVVRHAIAQVIVLANGVAEQVERLIELTLSTNTRDKLVGYCQYPSHKS